MTTHTSDTESFWDSEAGGYDAAHDGADVAGNPLWIRMQLVCRLLGSTPGSVLDCGMGPGRLLLELERRGWNVAGVDVSNAMVDRARARLPGCGDRLLRGSVESLPFPAASFDAAVATGVLEYVEDVPRALAEVARVLRPDGIFVASMPGGSLGTLWRHRVVYPSTRAVKALLHAGRPAPLRRPGLLPLRRLRDLFVVAGLELERIEYVVVPPSPNRVLPRAVAAWLTQRLEAAGERLGGWRNAQYVAVARKPAARG